ncbi:MAG: hypothetical protein FRX49_05171 [Trebouxia sp. A1-2]|nr:MAG: hypothetical protein FRX49_05171 [Trebouxia sp. A1-2]
MPRTPKLTLQPPNLLWIMYQCPLSQAQYVQAKLVHGQQELLKVQALPTLYDSHQLHVMDFMASSLGLVASLRPAAKQLQPKRPPQGLCLLMNYVLVLETVLVLFKN